MVSFSKFICGQRNSKQVLDSEGYTYVRKKDKDTALSFTWRCTKNRSLKCPSKVFLAFSDNHLSTGSKPHNHSPERKTSNKDLYDICCTFATYTNVLDYLFEVAKYFGHDV